MPTPPPDPACPGGCAALRAEMAEMKQHFQAQMDALREALARAQKHSSNRSKPPSSAIVKPPKPSAKKGKKCRQDGQSGHTKYERTFQLWKEADVIHDHHLDRWPACGGDGLLPLAGAEQMHQQYELVEKPIVLHAHQSHVCWCESCDRIQAAPFLPTITQGGLVGPRLTGLIGYLKGSGHLSYTTLQALLDEGLGAVLSTGMLAKMVDKVSQVLQPIYPPLLEALPDQKQLDIDETSHKDQGQLW